MAINMKEKWSMAKNKDLGSMKHYKRYMKGSGAKIKNTVQANFSSKIRLRFQENGKTTCW